MNKINFVGGDKLLPVFKHGFLRPEEAMFENWQKPVSSNKIDVVYEKITYYIVILF